MVFMRYATAVRRLRQIAEDAEEGDGAARLVRQLFSRGGGADNGEAYPGSADPHQATGFLLAATSRADTTLRSVDAPDRDAAGAADPGRMLGLGVAALSHLDRHG